MIGLHDAVSKLEDAVLAALARGEPPGDIGAHALLLLLRRYHAGARDDIGDVLGRALAAALETHTSDRSTGARAAWLAVFVEASSLSDDERLIGAVGALATGLRELWRSHRIDERAAAIGGCLVAAGLEPFQSYAPDAIDELERLVARTYEPGEVFGDTADQVRTASTLLTAYALSGRLPYSMLAEELIQPMRTGGAAGPSAFAVSCEGARVLCRLANLHDDP